MQSIGNSIKGPTTSAIAINSCAGKEVIAIAKASGELRANVVIVKLAYSSYVKLIFSDNNKSIIALVAKNITRGTKITTIESKFVNNSFPSLEKMQKTASDRKSNSNFENRSVTFSFILSFNKFLVNNEIINGITITNINDFRISIGFIMFPLEKRSLNKLAVMQSVKSD